MSLRLLRFYWRRFWFRPQSPLPVAVVRILFGLLFVQFAIMMAPELHALFGAEAMVTSSAAHQHALCQRLSLLDIFPDNVLWLDLVFLTFSVAAVCLTLGLFTRTSAILTYIGFVSFDARNIYIFGAPDMMLRTVSFLLIFTQAGQALSLDRLLRMRRNKSTVPDPPRASSPWGLRLIQVFMAFVYWAAFSRKLIGPKWLDGTAVYYVSHFLEHQRFTPSFIFDNLEICKLFTWGTLAVEFSLFSLIWIDKFRAPLILLGILFHSIMDASLILPQFQFAMMAGLAGFLQPSTLNKMMDWIKRSVHR